MNGNEEILYKKLIKAHYVECLYRIKRKYNAKTYKEVYAVLESREKLTLKLQRNVCELLDNNNKNVLIGFFENKKNSVSSMNHFINSLMCLDTSVPINAKSYNIYKEMVNYLISKKQWKE